MEGWNDVIRRYDCIEKRSNFVYQKGGGRVVKDQIFISSWQGEGDDVDDRMEKKKVSFLGEFQKNT